MTVFIYAAKIVFSRMRDKGKNIKRSMVFPKDTGGIFQKDSFWLSKGLVLECKRTRFGLQKDSF